MIRLFLLFLFFFSSSLYGGMRAYNIFPDTIIQKLKITVLDTKYLDFKGVHELSALAYKNGKLYALSDSGILYLFDISIENKKIKSLHLKNSFVLKNSKGRVFKKKKRDSEGICFYKKGFLVSFERKNRILYVSKSGKKIKKMQLNTPLEENRNYRSPNKGLESVAYSKKYGVVTIPELPLKGDEEDYHTLYAKKELWHFRASGCVTDIVFEDKDEVLVLLRQFSYLTRRRVTTLLRLNLKECNSKNVCKTTLLAKLDSALGWKNDNFEGLTKVKKNLYLMVSDDNDSIFQKTLLVLFEIKS
jgi:hypothetical protein